MLCGRPLGLAWDTIKEDNLIVMDSSTGIFELNVKTKKLKLIVLTNQVVGNEVRTFTSVTFKVKRLTIVQ